MNKIIIAFVLNRLAERTTAAGIAGWIMTAVQANWSAEMTLNATQIISLVISTGIMLYKEPSSWGAPKPRIVDSTFAVKPADPVQ